MQIQGSQFWDKVGATASAVCAVHCLLTGVALGLLSTLGIGFFANPIVDFLFLGVAVAVGSIATVHGVRKHHSWGPATAYVAGLGLLFFAHFHGPHPGHLEHNHASHGHGHDSLSTMLSVLGGLSFVSFHIWNLRLQKIHNARCHGCKPLCAHESEQTEPSTLTSECPS